MEIGLRLTASYMVTEVDRAKGPLETPRFHGARQFCPGPGTRGLAQARGGRGAGSEMADTRTPARVHLELPWLLTEREVL